VICAIQGYTLKYFFSKYRKKIEEKKWQKKFFLVKTHFFLKIFKDCFLNQKQNRRISSYLFSWGDELSLTHPPNRRKFVFVFSLFAQK